MDETKERSHACSDRACRSENGERRETSKTSGKATSAEGCMQKINSIVVRQSTAGTSLRATMARGKWLKVLSEMCICMGKVRGR